jgi:tetratricopeptide (TPR) repeat protein
MGVGQVLATLGVIAQEEGALRQAYDCMADSLDALKRVKSTSYMYVMALRQMALVQLDRAQPEDALARVEEALAICTESGMADLQVTLGAIKGMALLQLGQGAKALVETETAVSYLQDSVDQSYLVWWWHSQALEANGRTGEAVQALDNAYTLLLAHVSPLTEAQQQHTLQALHDHAAIVAKWQAGSRQIEVSLPHVDAPTGRPLRDDEFVTDVAVVGKKPRRQHCLVRLLDEAAAQNAAPTVQDLADALQVSPGTIKRDLAELRKSGQQINTRGRGDTAR